MEVILEGSNSAETLPPWDGVAGGHLPVTGKLAVWLDNRNLFFLFSFLLFSFYPIIILQPHSIYFFNTFSITYFKRPNKINYLIS